MQVSVSDYLSELTVPTISWLQGKFPTTGRESAEDAVQDALVFMLENRDRYQAQFGEAKGEARRLFRTVAWRSLRGQLRTKGHRTTQLPELSDAAPSPFELAAAAELQALSLCALPRALEGFRQEHRPALERAFLDKLQWLEGDAELARRHGVRREYVGATRRRVAALLRPV